MPRPTVPVAVRHPEAGAFVTLDPGADYADDDILVTSYPWAFVAKEVTGGIVESVSVPVVEQATAEPGQKRTRGKPRKPRAARAPKKTTAAKPGE